MDIISNLSLLSVGAVVAAIGILGFLIYFNNPKSLTNRTFLYLSFSVICWSVFNYLTLYQSFNFDVSIWYLRLVMLSAIWFAFFLYKLSRVFPEEKVVLGNWYHYFAVPAVLIVALLSLTPSVFKSVASLSGSGQIVSNITGQGIKVFGVVVVGFLISSIINLVRQTLKAQGERRKQFKLVTTGLVLTFLLLIIFNFILPAFLHITTFVVFGPVFVFPFIGMTFYAIYKHGLLHIKVLSVSVLAFVLSFASLAQIIFSIKDDFLTLLFRIVIFVVTLIVSVFLIKSVLREVEQREKLQTLSGQLKRTNTKLNSANAKLEEVDKRKTEFLSLASHQLRSPITAIKGYTSMFLEGSYGEVNEVQREPISRVFQSSLNLANVVEDLLDVAKIEQGGMKYVVQDIDLETITSALYKEFALTAKSKGLELQYDNAGASPCMVSVDPVKFRQVILNLLDNSIKYTQSGFVKLSIKKEMNKTGKAGNAIVAISDSGMGMSPETKTKLFGKFARGEGTKVNAGGSGIGLYLVKEIVEAHGGKVSADSPGLEKGSVFTVTLPLKIA
ncbi:MAG: hypothetical protein KBB70_01520 [Candidatus Pacebacteria bacterium]|nr:hypothetical protein [Candidatus Paceibacterota bacterium]